MDYLRREKYEAKVFDSYQHDFMNTIEPLLTLKRRIHDFSLPTIRIYKDREWPNVETTYNFSDKEKESLRQIDEAIEATKKSYQRKLREETKYFVYYRYSGEGLHPTLKESNLLNNEGASAMLNPFTV